MHYESELRVYRDEVFVEGDVEERIAHPSPARRYRRELADRDGNMQTLARGLGWFSVGLGVAEVLMPGTLARSLGREAASRCCKFMVCGRSPPASVSSMLRTPHPGSGVGWAAMLWTWRPLPAGCETNPQAAERHHRPRRRGRRHIARHGLRQSFVAEAKRATPAPDA